MKNTLTNKQYLRLLTDLENATNYLKSHKWTTGVEFEIDPKGNFVSACAIGAVRGGVYNGSLKLNESSVDNLSYMNGRPRLGISMSGCDVKGSAKHKSDLNERYNRVVEMLDLLTAVRTKGDQWDIVNYNDSTASRKRDVVSIFENAKKALIGGKFYLSEYGGIEPKGSLAKKLNRLGGNYDE